MDEKSKQILARLRRQTNGAVSAAMRENGIEYRINMGVSLPTIKNICKDYFPDHDLAKHMYVSKVREMILSALLIADPQKVSEELEFWSKGIINTEIGAVAATSLLCHSDVDESIGEWFSKSPLLCYTALLTAAKKIMTGKISDSSADSIVRLLASSPVVFSSEDLWLWQGVVSLFTSMIQRELLPRVMLDEFISGISVHNQPLAVYIKEETEWLCPE